VCVCWKVELEDALACDDDVLEEVFQFVDPPLNTVIRVPQMFIAQLRHELGWFLHLVYDYGIPVFYWAHHQFADVVRKRYLLRCDVFYCSPSCASSDFSRTILTVYQLQQIA